MHIVIIGLGEVGRYLLRVFGGEGHDVVAIDSDPHATGYAEEHYDVATVLGYGASQDTLEKASVSKADLVVAVTNHDEVNLIAALAAQQLGAKQVIARAQGDEWARWTEGVRYGLLGADVVINPRVLIAQELAKIARSHGASVVIDLAQNRIELVQLELVEENRHTGKPLAQLALPPGILIAAIVRGGELFVPGGADVLLPGDRAFVIGKPSAVLATEDLFLSRREARRVAIVGGGVIGQALAQALVLNGAEVLIIEQDRERAVELSAKLPRATIVHGDGTDLALLKQEEVASYDLFAAVTPHDEINLMAALLARRIEVPRTASVVQRGDYMEIYRQLGIDIALSPRAVAADHILRYSRSEEIHSLTVLEGGQAEVVELTARRGCRAVGSPLKHLSLPRGALLAAIIHEDEVIVPRGDDVVRNGDRVILLTTVHARPMVERLFRSKLS